MNKYLFLLIFSGIIHASAAVAQTGSQQGLKVIGYFYNGWGNADNIPFDYLTTVNYCFASVSPTTGEIQENFDPPKLIKVVQEARKHNVNVLLTVGGPKANDDFRKMSADPGRRSNFVASASQLIKKYNLDGIDIDWEYPLLSDNSSNNFTSLLRELSSELSPAKKIISIAANGSGFYADCIQSAAFPYISYINIMAYDDPNKSRASHSTYTYAKESLDYWISTRKLPRSKAILGLPTYGKSRKTGRPAYYKDLVKSGASPFKDSFDTVDYNGIPTIEKKMKLARGRAGGVMIWEVNLDAKGPNSIIEAIHTHAN